MNLDGLADQATVSLCRRPLTMLVMTASVGISLLRLLSLIPGIWFFDQLSQFRLFYILILTICVLTLAALRAFQFQKKFFALANKMS